MAVPLLNYEESNSLDFDKLKKKQNKHSCLKTISWAILFSSLVYLSIFHVFNLSPVSLVSTPKFWFFISNALVAIIATDLSAFLKTTTIGHDQFYDEYVKSHARASAPTFEYPHVRNNEKMIPEGRETDREEVQEKVIYMDHGTTNNNQRALALYKPLISPTTPDRKSGGLQANEVIKVENKGRTPDGVKCARSNSDKSILMAAVPDNEEKTVLQRTLSERHQSPSALEENELSSISDEELNRRVEEFIRKFNRQIRLQAARSRQN